MADLSLMPTDLDLARYLATGYLAVRGRFRSDEVEGWRRECDRLWRAAEEVMDTDRFQHRSRVGGGIVADRIDPIVDISPLFAELTREDRIVEAVSAALESDAVLMKAKLVTKRPGTMGYAMHQDFPYWEWMGIPADELLTVQVAIDPANRENGAVELFGGLHHARIDPDPNNPLDVDETSIDLARGERVELEAGDLLLFHSLTPHRSAPNQSTVSRRALFLTYCSAHHQDAYERYHERSGVRP